MREPSRRERWLTFLIVPAIVVAVLVLGGYTFRATFQVERLGEQSVVDATLSVANERADLLDKRIIEEDNVVLAEADLGALPLVARRWLPTAARETPTVRAVLVLDPVSSTHDVLAFASRAAGGPEDDAFRRLLVERLLPELELTRPPLDELRHLHKSVGGQSYLVSYSQRVHAGRPYLVVAWHDVPRIVHDFMPRLYPDVAGSTRMNVVDEDGRVVFGPPLRGGEFTVGKPFPTTLYNWRLQVTLGSAEQLRKTVAQRQLFQSLMVGLSCVVVIAGMAAVLIASERDRRLSALKSDFVANVSHELKTPLSLVRMFAELLASGRVASEAKRVEYLQIILHESERLTGLIDNVLDFAKLERDRSPFVKTEADVADVVARAVEVYRYRAEREGIAIEVAAPDAPAVASVDERAIELVVINLLDNALKYAKEGKVVRVETRVVGAEVHVRVTDQGPGIPPDERRRIFERFVRGDGATRGQVRGSGIGLALVQQIARSHGGRAWVESEVGRGSTFVVALAAGRRA